ncbi:hypothetical protein EU545_01290 [Candidatus Thorarchaeota archaeon]|nr:MAG: hypothetical protein EU545_01290 [Candidatus Thorarchaeota archaeon]
MREVLEQELRERILREITPSDEELKRQKSVIGELTSALRDAAKTLGQSYSFIEPQGSTGAKQTQLKGAADIDLFVALDTQDFASILELPVAERNRRLSSELERLVDIWFRPAARLTGAQKIKKTYSQHPYLSLVLDGLEVDIVTCFDLSADYLMTRGPITAVDRTIHHTRYVCKKLDNRLRGDVRLLKSFIRAGYAYGDRCAVGRMGITGYCLELLVIWGDGLEGAFESLRNLPEQPLDPEERPINHLKSKPEFRDDYVIVIDPIDTNRNVASSFSARSVDWTILRADDLPSSSDPEKILHMFIEEPITTAPLPRDLEGHFVGIEFKSKGTEHYTILRDKLYSLASKIADRVSEERTGEKRFGQCIFELYFERPRYALGFLVERPSIDPQYKRRGPPTNMKNAVAMFKAEHPDAYEEKGFLWAKETREWTSAGEMVMHLVRENEVDALQILEDTGALTRKVGNILRTAVLRVEEMHFEQ